MIQHRHYRDVFLSRFRFVYSSSVSARDFGGTKRLIEEVRRTRTSSVNRHADDCRACHARTEFVKLQAVLLCNARSPCLRVRGAYTRHVRGGERLAVWRDASKGAGTDAE
jgi:hypothetical protein